MVTVEELTRQVLVILQSASNPLSEISRAVRKVLETNGIKGRNPDFVKTHGAVTQRVFEQMLNPPWVPKEDLGIHEVEVSWPEEAPEPVSKKKSPKKVGEPQPEEAEADSLEEEALHQPRDWMDEYEGY